MEAAMRTLTLLVPIALLLASAVTASGEGTERYQLQKTDTGYVRLNTETGEMSICEERTGQLVCKAAAEERAAFQEEIDRLQAKLQRLRCHELRLR
ncbi:MAG TPA: hypothetical protein PL196_09720, partial [Burkholderiaceae bacterium]|nr:hypothetical protein [Burkholderiaceae bacterium]